MLAKRSGTTIPTMERAALGVLALLLLDVPVFAQSRTYTLDGDFDAGVMASVNHSAVHDQLQLDATTSRFDFVWVANSQRGTLVRIDAVTGAVLGEYRTAPGSHARGPSRTAVDAFGNVWTGNRSEAAGGQGSVVKVGVVLGGTRVSKRADGTIVPDNLGGYLAPPFALCTAVDRNGDGLIRTSRGLGDILPWNDLGDGLGGPTGVVQDADDECILLFQRTSAPAVHQVSLDRQGNLWAGMYPSSVFDVLDGTTAGLLRTVSPGCGGYGGFIDASGVLWSSNQSQGRLLRYDIATGNSLCTPVTLSSGLACDPSGRVWNTMWTNNTIVRLDAQGGVATGFPSPTFGGGSFGVAVTPADGDVWVANSNTLSVTRLTPEGSLRKRLTVGGSPNGTAVDARGKVWVTCQLNSTAARIDPHGGTDGLGAVDLLVSLGSGAGPADYGDMAGSVTTHDLAPGGTWTVVFDSGRSAMAWSRISWHGDEPQGTGLAVAARAADSAPGVESLAWVPVANGGDIDRSALRGRYVQMRVTFSRDPAVKASPVLHDLTVDSNESPDCSGAYPSLAEIWPPDGRMVGVDVLGVTDPDGDPVSIVVTRISQDEPVDAPGSGRTAPDCEGLGTASARVRAERAGGGNGRVYAIHFTASDGRGGACEGQVQVCVPHDMGTGHDCSDDGQRYDSNQTLANPRGQLAARQFPNPFNPVTTIGFTLPFAADLQLSIYDARGREVRRLATDHRAAGQYALVWDGRDDFGQPLASGVYVYSVRAGGLESRGRMLLVK